MWGICQICGVVVADEQLHTDWHAAHGDVAPDPVPTT